MASAAVGTDPGAAAAPFNRRLGVLLAMAMFVLVVDTSLMNVSISAVVEDLDTTVSGVQSAIALEALISAAFILINSKVGDLIGRKRAYVLGLLHDVGRRVTPTDMRHVLEGYYLLHDRGFDKLVLPSLSRDSHRGLSKGDHRGWSKG